MIPFNLAKPLRNAKSALDVYDFREVALSEDDKGITFYRANSPITIKPAP
jgi:hypothetical protein